MKKIAKSVVRKGLAKLGYELRRVSKTTPCQVGMARPPAGSKIYMGCGEDRREGYVGCDMRALPSVDIVCRAWELSRHVSNAGEIYSRHMLEHLTLAEVECTLLDWFEALDIGGKVHIVVPDMDFHVQQWIRATWTPETFREPKSDARYSFSGFNGWQRECDPRKPNYNGTYWDVHKSAFNKQNMTFLLKMAGFAGISVETEEQVHLVAKAMKILNKGERQVTPFLGEIRADLRGRYLLAQKHMLTGKVLDIACGIGYGTQMLANFSPESHVTGVDIHKGAIQYAREYYSAPNADFVEGDALSVEFASKFDTVVSFETVEHLPDYERFVARIYGLLKDGGRFILSTPNLDAMPYTPQSFPYHIRHFTPAELAKLLEDAGFHVEHWYSQRDQNSVEAESNTDGRFLIVVAHK